MNRVRGAHKLLILLIGSQIVGFGCKDQNSLQCYTEGTFSVCESHFMFSPLYLVVYQFPLFIEYRF